MLHGELKPEITFFDLFEGGQKVISDSVRVKQNVLTLTQSCTRFGEYRSVIWPSATNWWQ